MLRDVNGLAEKFEETEENPGPILEDCAEDAMQTIDDFFYFLQPLRNRHRRHY